MLPPKSASTRLVLQSCSGAQQPGDIPWYTGTAGLRPCGYPDRIIKDKKEHEDAEKCRHFTARQQSAVPIWHWLLSQETYDFVDWLKEAGQTYWQILPLGVTSYGDSPYQSFSAFAGNPYFISLDELVKEGVLTAEECKKAKFGRKADDIDYSQLYKERGRLLRLAYSRSDIGHNAAFAAFCEKNKWWLDDFACSCSERPL